MIRVNNKYGIVPSATDYAVVEIRMNQKKHEEYLNYLTYHADLQTALKRIASFYMRDAVIGDMTLSEAVERIDKALAELSADIKKAVPKARVVVDD